MANWDTSLYPAPAHDRHFSQHSGLCPSYTRTSEIVIFFSSIFHSLNAIRERGNGRHYNNTYDGRIENEKTILIERSLITARAYIEMYYTIVLRRTRGGRRTGSVVVGTRVRATRSAAGRPAFAVGEGRVKMAERLRPYPARASSFIPPNFFPHTYGNKTQYRRRRRRRPPVVYNARAILLLVTYSR